METCKYRYVLLQENQSMYFNPIKYQLTSARFPYEKLQIYISM